MTTGWVYEVFSSIQGEGLYCGQRQTFVRLAGCNLSCSYCDTAPAQDHRPMFCRIEEPACSGRFAEIANPVSVEDIVGACGRLGAKVISLTGGEPLMQAEFAGELMRQLKANGFSTHLETNGTLWNELADVIQHVDVVAMDIKLPGADGRDYWEESARFLNAASGKQVFVKIVAAPDTSVDLIGRCAELIANTGKDIPLIIQPVTGREPVLGDTLIRLQEAASRQLSDVRVIPQCHKILGIL